MKVAVMSDIHGNMEAFEAVLADIGNQGISDMICIGDLVGYGPNPEEVVRMVRQCDIRCTIGNHELGVAVKAERKWFNPKARQTLSHTERLMSTESLEYISCLPRIHNESQGLFVHGFPPESIRTYLFEKDIDEIGQYLLSAEPTITFVGHTHDLELVTWDGKRAERHTLGRGEHVLGRSKTIVNVGSVGQPRDGDKHAKYVIWEPAKGTIDVRFIAYDAQTTVAKILKRGFPEYYASRLL